MEWFYSGYDNLSGIALTAGAIYLASVVMLRATGKRTLAQFNIFDLVVTIALGSLIATAVLSDSISVVEGAVGLATLIGMQWLTARAIQHSRWLRDLIKSDPRALVVDGAYCHEAMAREGISEGEVRSAMRMAGFAAVEDVGAVVLEPDGRISVLRKGRGSALEAVAGVPVEEKADKEPS